MHNLQDDDADFCLVSPVATPTDICDAGLDHGGPTGKTADRPGAITAGNRQS